MRDLDLRCHWPGTPFYERIGKTPVLRTVFKRFWTIASKRLPRQCETPSMGNIDKLLKVHLGEGVAVRRPHADELVSYLSGPTRHGPSTLSQ
jgi:hypothetical protein